MTPLETLQAIKTLSREHPIPCPFMGGFEFNDRFYYMGQYPGGINPRTETYGHIATEHGSLYAVWCGNMRTNVHGSMVHMIAEVRALTDDEVLAAMTPAELTERLDILRRNVA